MLEHQVIDILKSLSADEVKQLKRFLSSPYFVRSETINMLFEQLIKFYPAFNNKKLTKEFIYSKVFGEGKYNDSTFRNIMINLLEICELFLMNENFKKTTSYTFDYLLRELSEKNISSVFERNTTKIEKQLSTLENINSDYYLAKHKLELNKFNFNVLNEKINESTDADIRFNEIFKSGLYLTIHYITEIVPMYLTSVFYSIQYNRPLVNDFFNKLISTINIKGLENLLENTEHNFIVNIYISLLKAFQKIEDKNAYREYKSIFKNNIDKLGKDEIWFHYSNLINYCTLNILNKRDTDYYNEELFVLYDEILQNDYYKNKKTNYLRFEFYRDILLFYLQQKKITTAENFILKYSSKLHKSDKDNMMNLAYAYLYFEKGEYMQSWKYFNKINIDYFIYKYDIKSYALKIYFELGYYEEALTLIENYKRFLERNELVSEELKKKKKNFIYYLSKLILIKAGQIPYKQFATYRRRLELANDTTSRDWILNKYESFATEMKQNKQLKSA